MWLWNRSYSHSASCAVTQWTGSMVISSEQDHNLLPSTCSFSQIRPRHQEQSLEWEDSIAETQQQHFCLQLCVQSHLKRSVWFCLSVILRQNQTFHYRIWCLGSEGGTFCQSPSVSLMASAVNVHEFLLICSLTPNCLKEQLNHSDCSTWEGDTRSSSFPWGSTQSLCADRKKEEQNVWKCNVERQVY